MNFKQVICLLLYSSPRAKQIVELASGSPAKRMETFYNLFHQDQIQNLRKDINKIDAIMTKAWADDEHQDISYCTTAFQQQRQDPMSPKEYNHFREEYKEKQEKLNALLAEADAYGKANFEALVIRAGKLVADNSKGKLQLNLDGNYILKLTKAKAKTFQDSSKWTIKETLLICKCLEQALDL